MRRRRNPPRGGGLLLGAGALGLAWWLFGDLIRYGKSAGPSAKVGGWIPTSPKALASTAGVHEDVYTLAAVMRSEAGSGPEPERVAVAWVARNAARAKGVSVTAWATRATGPSAGYYGPQNIQKRIVSTSKAPRSADLKLAQAIMNGEIRDNTGGATHFLHPAGQDALARLGLKGYTKGSADVIARWKASGLDPRNVVGAPRILVFVPVGKKALVATAGAGKTGAS